MAHGHDLSLGSLPALSGTEQQKKAAFGTLCLRCSRQCFFKTDFHRYRVISSLNIDYCFVSNQCSQIFQQHADAKYVSMSLVCSCCWTMWDIVTFSVILYTAQCKTGSDPDVLHSVCYTKSRQEQCGDSQCRLGSHS